MLALLLYRRRRLETAGDAVAVAWLKPIFKYLLSVAGAFGLGYLLFGIVSSTVRYGTAAYAANWPYSCAPARSSAILPPRC